MLKRDTKQWLHRSWTWVLYDWNTVWGIALLSDEQLEFGLTKYAILAIFSQEPPWRPGQTNRADRSIFAALLLEIYRLGFWKHGDEHHFRRKRGWGADHTGQFRHHPSASPVVIVKKMVDHHLFLNIIPSNFTARTEWKVWCDRGMKGGPVERWIAVWCNTMV